MIHSGEKYINPLTDFGFKRIFGTEFNKDLLISFLNALLYGERQIADVTYENSEKFGSNEAARKAVFDVYCTTKEGSRFIVEMQNVYQEFYKTARYTTLLLQFPTKPNAATGTTSYTMYIRWGFSTSPSPKINAAATMGFSKK